MENPVSKHVDPDQKPHYVASDQCLHCLPVTLIWVFPGKNGQITSQKVSKMELAELLLLKVAIILTKQDHQWYLFGKQCYISQDVQHPIYMKKKTFKKETKC